MMNTAEKRSRGVPIDNPQNDGYQARRQEQIAVTRRTAIQCAHIAEEFRGQDIVVLDLTELTPIMDFFVIATGTSRRQMHAMADEIQRALRPRGERRRGREGYDSSNWILVDYGDIALHLFDEETRRKYDLERLWADAKPVDWKGAETPSANG
jgi:ribosome-associated protein